MASVAHDLRTPLFGISFLLDQAKTFRSKEDLY